jgi:hypothetical protein
MSARAEDLLGNVDKGRVELNVGKTGVAASIYSLKDAVPDTLLFLQHGFQRSKEKLEALASSLVDRHVAVLTITLTERQLGDASFARGVANAIAELQSELFESHMPQKVLVAGHSIGASFASSVGLALESAFNHLLQGVLLIDPVEKNGLLSKSMSDLSKDIPVLSVFGEKGMCNNMGGAAKSMRHDGANSLNLRLTHGTHCDAEAESTDLSCTSLCGTPRKQNLVYLRELVGGWSSGLSDGGVLDDYRPGGARIRDLEKRGAISVF